ncbi:hypothetical protein POVWA2_055150 [Plasmodium ovale wallikeri]|uniref:Uncharacterized protein n=1 Tax=Plasmodium ovale wallikeri TaxID=864142 RepID=A0A1A8ZT53_PLAOA|nr:hypothetical protein POVWA1_055450 [Plasmodium ovale wallikeri]SBT48007.1 hypothetical protein POVWA2_055150 [Plasmodium ovale wallikeri]
MRLCTFGSLDPTTPICAYGSTEKLEELFKLFELLKFASTSFTLYVLIKLCPSFKIKDCIWQIKMAFGFSKVEKGISYVMMKKSLTSPCS